MILSFNEHYALAILALLFLIIFVALLQPKLKHAIKRYDLPSFTNDDT
jgi:multisubunit Na+/H+ antiporter MnhG subunit